MWKVKYHSMIHKWMDFKIQSMNTLFLQLTSEYGQVTELVIKSPACYHVSPLNYYNLENEIFINM